MPAVLMIGAFDAKGAEYDFVRRQAIANGCEVPAADAATLRSTGRFPPTLHATRED
jgi:hypothetical protein